MSQNLTANNNEKYKISTFFPTSGNPMQKESYKNVEMQIVE